ncbi:MAG: hypothetical protein A2504_02045 [Bdellovibrionales bacterium RIFOXYD12_FULL_39_22]|nr:MAG: hypothetical protein A2385_12070 [Bdellovibrionales bacterium RIFOXYB1_FULL_39_21]OFZ41379.1 MAG: hypothetical protein A2485_01240 [Bdellovibrionales bacterium RIFOXYC12_FULL_39_17]OFZ45334.1 MAG: hypothetical protein A2404_13255 [Bdellovibrionales bacterium RIFOXYC1_FULL_39_130]OFZ69365.1 MAG: hypothetical protein A2451_06615 [Bdellovibrionales bacterium RIFOXYC2_FULL_39_8]OFZ74530.1 MAG: hypothetical protein A2560_12360 [Bdellovibrionales bacterium RIFOXYD1_FULL_39_84]OFZ92539.1 MAG:
MKFLIIFTALLWFSGPTLTWVYALENNLEDITEEEILLEDIEAMPSIYEDDGRPTDPNANYRFGEDLSELENGDTDDELLDNQYQEAQNIFGQIEQLDYVSAYGKQKKGKTDFILRTQAQRVTTTDPFWAIIPKGKIIYALDEEGNASKQSKHLITARDINAKVQVKSSDVAAAYIFDKHNATKYLINLSDIIPIQKDLDLLPRPTNLVSYAPPQQDSSIDYDLKLFAAINFGVETISPYYIGEIFNDSNVDSCYGNKLDLKTFLRWSVPVEFGINLNFQRSYMNLQLENYPTIVWQSVFLGPALRFPLYLGEKFIWRGEISYQHALSYGLTDYRYQYTFSGNALQFDLEISYHRYILGASYRLSTLSLRQTLPNEIPSDRNTIGELGLFIGYGLDFKI